MATKNIKFIQKFDENFKKEISEYLEKHKMSEHGLAIKAGIHPAQLNNYMKGEKRLYTETVEKLALAMD
jgi:transcriptional regulator with XRE-family HTH domain